MLFEGLLSTGKYKFLCFGSAIKHGDYNTKVVNPDFVVKPLDGFGTKEQVRQVLLTEKPDAIFIFTDPRQYIWLWDREDEIHQVCPIVYWHVWDNDPYPDFNDVWYKSTDLLNCLSWKTYEMVSEKHPEKTNYIPHAWPKDVYRRLPEPEVAKAKKELFRERANWFKALWVNRNAHRKLGNDLLVAWKQFLDQLEKDHGHRNALLFMHTNPKDPEGFDLEATANMLKLQGNVLFQPGYWDFPQMNLLYNAVDCSVNISKAEGFGLNVLTSLQCGRLVVANRTGGLARQVIDHRDGTEYGVAIEPATRILMGSVHLVPYIHDDYVNVNDVSAAFTKLYNMPLPEREALEKKAMEYVDYEFNYHKVVYQWDQTMTKCIEEFKTRTLENSAVKRFGLVDLAYTAKEPELKFAPFALTNFSKGKTQNPLTELKAVLSNAGSDVPSPEKPHDKLTDSPIFAK